MSSAAFEDPMRIVLVPIVAMLFLAACGDQAPAPLDTTVAFRVKTDDGVTTKAAITVLVVHKAGRTAIVEVPTGEPPKGSISGQHNFPPGVTASAIAAYYELLLRNAGWGEKDLHVDRDAGRLLFLGASSVQGWSDGHVVEVRLQAELR